MVAIKKVSAPDVPGKIDELAEVFEFRDEPVVRAFLEANADLLPLLEAIPDRIATYFPRHERLILEVFEDPENEVAPPELIALIPGRYEPGEALTCLDEMSRDWWLDAFRSAGGRINIDVEYLL